MTIPKEAPSKERQAWMAKWCRHDKNVSGWCGDLPAESMCGPEGRPDCPALKEMPTRELHLTAEWLKARNLHECWRAFLDAEMPK